MVTRHTRVCTLPAHRAAPLPLPGRCPAAWPSSRLGQECTQLRWCWFCFAAQRTYEKPECSRDSPGGSWGRDAPQPPPLVRTDSSQVLKASGDTRLVSGQWWLLNSSSAALGRWLAWVCSVDVDFVPVSKGVQGFALSQAEPRPWAAPCQSTSVLSPGTCPICALRVWRVCCAPGGAGWVARVGIRDLGRAGQCLCAFASPRVQVCASVRCFCTVWSILGCS